VQVQDLRGSTARKGAVAFMDGSRGGSRMTERKHLTIEEVVALLARERKWVEVEIATAEYAKGLRREAR
jgi:hypothetical protein